MHDCQPKLGMTTKLNNLEVNCDLLKLITPIRNRLMQYNGLMPRRAVTDNVIAYALHYNDICYIVIVLYAHMSVCICLPEVRAACYAVYTHVLYAYVPCYVWIMFMLCYVILMLGPD